MLKIQTKYHNQLADYFATLPLYLDEKQEINPNIRKLVEQPWQHHCSGQWEALYEFLKDIDLFKAFWEFNKFDFKFFWNCIEKKTKYKIESTYTVSALKPAKNTLATEYAMHHLFESGHFKESLELALSLENIFESKAYDVLSNRIDLAFPGMVVHHERMKLVEVLSYKAICCMYLGQMDEFDRQVKKAMNLGNECLDAFKDGMNPYIFTSLAAGAEAAIRQERIKDAEIIVCNLEDLLRLYKDSVEEFIPRKISILNIRSTIFIKKGFYNESLKVLSEAESICRNRKQKIGLAITRLNKALTTLLLKDFDVSLITVKQAENDFRALGMKSYLSQCLKIHGDILIEKKDFKQALKLAESSELLAKECNDQNKLAESFSLQARILGKEQKCIKSVELFEKSEEVYRNNGNLFGLGTCMINKALILCYECNDVDRAILIAEKAYRFAFDNSILELADRAEQILKDIRQHSIVIKYNNATKLRKSGDLNGSKELLINTYEKFDFEDSWKLLFPILHDLILMLVELEEWGKVSKYLSELEKYEINKSEDRLIKNIYISVGAIFDNFISKANNLSDAGDLNKSFDIYEKAREVAECINYQNGISLVKINQAIVMDRKGQSKSALDLLIEQEKVCRQCGDNEGLGLTIGYQAYINQKAGDINLAVERYEEAIAIHRVSCEYESMVKLTYNQLIILDSLEGFEEEIQQKIEEIYEICDSNNLSEFLKVAESDINKIRFTTYMKLISKYSIRGDKGLETGDIDSSIYFYEKSLSLSEFVYNHTDRNNDIFSYMQNLKKNLNVLHKIKRDHKG